MLTFTLISNHYSGPLSFIHIILVYFIAILTVESLMDAYLEIVSTIWIMEVRNNKNPFISNWLNQSLICEK